MFAVRTGSPWVPDSLSGVGVGLGFENLASSRVRSNMVAWVGAGARARQDGQNPSDPTCCHPNYGRTDVTKNDFTGDHKYL